MIKNTTPQTATAYDEDKILKTIPFYEQNKELKLLAYKFLFNPGDLAFFKMAQLKKKCHQEQEVAMETDYFVNNFKIYVLGFDAFKSAALNGLGTILDQANTPQVGLVLFSIESIERKLQELELYELMPRLQEFKNEVNARVAKWASRNKGGAIYHGWANGEY